MARAFPSLFSHLLTGLREVWRQVLRLHRQPAPLLALLVLLGSFAFQARVGGSLSLPAPPQVHQHHQHSKEPPQQAHDHSAHCPFCLTQAFGEVPAAPFVPLEATDFAPMSWPQQTRPSLAPLPTYKARAPPPSASPHLTALRPFA